MPEETTDTTANTITIFGFGSLLSEASARRTMPDLTHFRLVNVPGYRRVFNKVGVVFFQLYPELTRDTRKIASCSTQYDGTTQMQACAFEITEEAFSALYEREHRYRWIEVEAVDNQGETVYGRMCTSYNDADYRLNKCKTDTEYHQRVGQYYQGKLWRDDILPFPVYLKHCLSAVQDAGDNVYQAFLASSYLADGETTLHQFLQDNPGYLSSVDEGYHNR